MNPGRRHYRTQALCNNGNRAFRDSKVITNVPHKFVKILDESGHRRLRALLSAGAAMRPRIPGEKRNLRQVQLVHNVCHAPRMFMTAMDQYNRLITRSWPVAKENLYAVVSQEGTFFGNSPNGITTNGDC